MQIVPVRMQRVWRVPIEQFRARIRASFPHREGSKEDTLGTLLSPHTSVNRLAGIPLISCPGLGPNRTGIMRKKTLIGALIAIPSLIAFACGPRPTMNGTGGRGGGGGTAGTAGTGGAPPTVDITGTWYSRVVTEGKFQV